MNKVVSFGEILMRLSTEGNERFLQAGSFRCNYGGAEFNVAVGLSGYGIDSEFVTCVPKNELGDSALTEIRKQRVQGSHIIRGGERLGIYFLETGSGLRAGKVIYDRAHSSFSEIQNGMLNWKEILKDATWFHWSGITPAISQNATNVLKEALVSAREMGLRISVDLNFRSKLWNYGKKPLEVMPELLQYCNVILGDLDTACFMLGKDKFDPDYTKPETLSGFYGKLFEYCPSLKFAATTLRYSQSASHQRIGGILYDGKTVFSSKLIEVPQVVDRIGSGDAFMAGLIYGLLNEEKQMNEKLDFAVAACCLKHSIIGDYNLATIEEIEDLAAGNNSGKVSR